MAHSYLLDYILVVETFNHEIIKQTPDDKSRYTLGRSFFYDIKDLKIKKATLIGKGHTLSIDLVDGHAEVDGKVILPPQGTRPPEATDFKLIYYRQVQQQTTQTVELQGKKNRLFAKIFQRNKNKPASVKYYLGWTTNYKGKNYKWELGIT